MDGTELDEIMNEASASEVVETVETPAVETQLRDETGKFAAKPLDAEVANADPDKTAQAAVEGGEQGGAKVPVAAVQAERDKARQARDEAETLRREMAELRGQISILTQQRQQPAATQEKPKAKTFWENPDDFVAERIAPVQQAAQQQRFEMSRMLADDKFGADVVKAADDALGDLIKANDPAVAALQAQITNSRHPYADLVAWHQKRQAMADIGDDPGAYRDRLRAELMAELGIDAQPVPPVPSTTTKPLTKLPQSLSRLPGSGNGAGDVDASDAGIFNEAMAGR